MIPRENYDRGLPLAIMRCESKGMLKDGVVAIRDTMMYEPRYMRHIISALRVTGESPDGITVETNYAVFETLVDDLTHVFNVGRYLSTASLSRQGNPNLPRNTACTTRCWCRIR